MTHACTGHVDDVKAIVQRAIKDLSIEQALKKYEEIWLSKVFELSEHTRNSAIQAVTKDKETPVAADAQSDSNSQHAPDNGSVQPVPPNTSGSKPPPVQRSSSRMSSVSQAGRPRNLSVTSLPMSLTYIQPVYTVHDYSDVNTVT